MKAKSGFTLVEILIVVVILGILAAIVIPQFTDAAMEAKESRVRTELQTMRSQIELYKVQHNDNLPGAADTGFTPASFTAALTGPTDVHGAVGTDPSTDLGPYMQSLPTNPFNNASAVDPVTSNPSAGDTTDATGWWFNTVTGAFGANDTFNTSEHIDW
ncbi:MAG: type II secretion system protein [Planctomycetota bacterium]|jgi:general secretion pathway protein G